MGEDLTLLIGAYRPPVHKMCYRTWVAPQRCVASTSPGVAVRTKVPCLSDKPQHLAGTLVLAQCRYIASKVRTF